jgi:hypothetical protein
MRIAVALIALSLVPRVSMAATCVNKFVRRSDGPKQIVTLLTGKLTYQEAQALSHSIVERRAPPIEWIDDEGKIIARQYGELKVVRPMPVACDGKPSGSIIIATFISQIQPSKKMGIRFDPHTNVLFVEQSEK